MAYTITFDILAKDKASNVIDGVGDSTQRNSGKWKKWGAAAGAAALAVGAVAVKVGWDVANMASDQEEALNKSNVIFGKNAGAIEKWADGAAKSAGLSKTAALDAAAGFGDMFSQLGFGAGEAANMSTSVVQLAADLGSFNNLDTAEVVDMISASFRGEYDSLQRLIPNINAARVETEALAMTGKKSAKELTAQEKAAATLAIVQKDGARAAGDFARTSDGLANQQKILKAEFDNVKSELGKQLLPVLTSAGKWLIDEGVPAVKNFVESLKNLKASFSNGGAEGSKFGKALEDARPFIDLAIAAIKGLWVVIRDGVIPIMKKWYSFYIPMMLGALKALGVMGIGLWNNFLAPAFRWITGGLSKLMGVWAAMLRGLSKVPGFGWAATAADTMERAAGKADRLSRSIKNIPRSRNVSVNAVIRTTFSGSGARYIRPGQLGAFATGGAVLGPGTSTSDSIPALLSDNEHVWTAREVEGAGGHENVERWRALARKGNLPRLRDGGPVRASAAGSAMFSGAGIHLHFHGIATDETTVARGVGRMLRDLERSTGRPIGLLGQPAGAPA